MYCLCLCVCVFVHACRNVYVHARDVSSLMFLCIVHASAGHAPVIIIIITMLYYFPSTYLFPFPITTSLSPLNLSPKVTLKKKKGKNNPPSYYCYCTMCIIKLVFTAVLFLCLLTPCEDKSCYLIYLFVSHTVLCALYVRICAMYIVAIDTRYAIIIVIITATLGGHYLENFRKTDNVGEAKMR